MPCGGAGVRAQAPVLGSPSWAPIWNLSIAGLCRPRLTGLLLPACSQTLRGCSHFGRAPWSHPDPHGQSPVAGGQLQHQAPAVHPVGPRPGPQPRPTQRPHGRCNTHGSGETGETGVWGGRASGQTDGRDGTSQPPPRGPSQGKSEGGRPSGGGERNRDITAVGWPPGVRATGMGLLWAPGPGRGPGRWRGWLTDQRHETAARWCVGHGMGEGWAD